MINALPGGGSRTILLSKRANIFYLDRVRVMMEHERVVYRMEADGEALDYNLPDCNTALVLLGKGSSITDAAARALAKSGVVLGFAGSGGTPAHSLVDYVFLNPADEYRPTEYCQKWVKMWLDEQKRLDSAKKFQKERLSLTVSAWRSNTALRLKGLEIPEPMVKAFEMGVENSADSQGILLAEAAWTKKLYAILAKGFDVGAFTRKSGEGEDIFNELLDHGNYLMYGLATVALHALGIPPSFPLVHGSTRRGALVFDVADLVKDAISMPLAFECAAATAQKKPQMFRAMLIEKIQANEIIDLMIKKILSLIDA
jgi:CRISP-associated protein Cas1